MLHRSKMLHRNRIGLGLLRWRLAATARTHFVWRLARGIIGNLGTRSTVACCATDRPDIIGNLGNGFRSWKPTVETMTQNANDAAICVGNHWQVGRFGQSLSYRPQIRY